MPKPIIWIVDTSVLLNVLEHPDRSQDREAIVAAFEERIRAGHRFAIPLTTIIETGNWAYKMAPGLRAAWATKLAKFITDSLSGDAPFIIMDFPERDDVANFLTRLPQYVDRMGLGDLMIHQQWEQLCSSGKFGGYQLNVWSLDKVGLQGLECNH
ncbi:hypothetical protein FUA23_11325 [Neolewinella aurantiaca]|uniref:PIN domain-containing protein n=1 Tax=Neolewinella aurantiaca TaxID=2602767 RepID=A0A5C7FWN1_9BACT|nr:hypothetical protein [Neolewinella aurantiaca]TXF89328.1 hypothetical protein FUA23_11325 [Neolewinella aurantiaca]